MFYRRITENFEHFHYFNFDTSFLENENLILKTEAPLFSWKYHNDKRHISIKTALSKANVKTNRMGSTKWTCHSERGFATNYIIFLKI